MGKGQRRAELIEIETRDAGSIPEDCSLRITRIGQEFCSPQKKPEKTTRDYYSLHFVLFGAGILRDGENIYKIKAGSSFLLYEGREYEYYPDPKNPWTYVWVDIRGKNLDSLFERAGFLRDEPVIKLGKMNEFNPILRSLYDSYSYELYGELAYYGYFLLVLDRLIDNNTVFPEQNKAKILNKKLIRNILIFMNNNSKLNLTPKEIGEKFNISYGTLMGLFKSEVGISPMQYLTRFRISNACMLLREKPDMPIGQIALSVGYQDPLYFSRMFKKIRGVSPTEYRERHEGDDPHAWLKERDLDFR